MYIYIYVYMGSQRYYDFASKHGFPQKINYDKKCSVLLLFRIVGDALEMFILMGRCELLFLYVLVTFALCRGYAHPVLICTSGLLISVCMYLDDL